MNYIQVDISTTSAGTEPVGGLLLNLGIPGYSTQDPADFERFLRGEEGRWDYIDQNLMKLREGVATLTAYLPDNSQGSEILGELRAGLKRLQKLDTAAEWGRLTASVGQVEEEDWANNWKQYYAPTPVGKHLVICPSWEEYKALPGQTVVLLDPGMAFGTGTHESTRLCLELLEEANPAGKRVLDLGCGSGILTITAALLGAAEALGVDIDEASVKTAGENAGRNGAEDRTRFCCGSLAEKVSGTFDIVLMNIVADVILSFLPEVAGLLRPGGVFLTSGIIDTRAEDVLGAMEAAGLVPFRREYCGGWVGIGATATQNREE